MTVYLAQALGGGTYELAASARAFVSRIDKLHDAYLAAPESKQGKIPVVRMDGVELIETTTSHGTNRNYAPRLLITGWQLPPATQKKAPPSDFPGDNPPPRDFDDEIPFGRELGAG